MRGESRYWHSASSGCCIQPTQRSSGGVATETRQKGFPMSQNGTGEQPKSFWSFPRREDEILKLKDAGARRLLLRKLRKARWWWLIAVLITFLPLVFLPNPKTDYFWFMTLWFMVLFANNERQIDQILIVDLLILPQPSESASLQPAAQPSLRPE